MAGAVGRDLLVKKASTVIAGIRTATLSYSGESIDIASGEDTGKRLLLAEAGQEQIDLAVEGIMKAVTFREIALGSASNMLTDITITWPLSSGATTAATLSGNFRISAYEEGAPYNDAITFSATLESSGAWTYTAEV